MDMHDDVLLKVVYCCIQMMKWTLDILALRQSRLSARVASLKVPWSDWDDFSVPFKSMVMLHKTNMLLVPRLSLGER